jgi:multiple antibiotic resistance protein
MPPPLLHDFLRIFIPLLVVMDPAGVLPLFLSLTQHYSEGNRRIIARRAAIVAGVTGIVILIIGQALFNFVGVRFADFQIAGGALVFVLAIIDLLSRGKPAVDEAQIEKTGDQALPADVGIVPLAVPLIVGPATMTTSLLLVSTYSGSYSAYYGSTLGPALITLMVAAALVLNLLLLFVAMYHSGRIEQLVGRQTMSVINKIVMILLAAIAVSLIRQGLTTIIHDWQTR